MDNRKTACNITYTQARVSCFVGQESHKFTVQFFVGSTVVKIPAFAKPQTVSRNSTKNKTMKKNLMILILILTSQICFGLKPETKYIATPDSLGLTNQTNKITSSNGIELNSWLIESDKEIKNGTTLILCYGDMGNMSYWLNQAGILSQVGYDVLLFDYRGFGESSKFDISSDYLYYDEFADDLSNVIKWAKNNLKYNELGLISFSMGTIMSTIALQEENVDFFIGEGFVLNPKEIQAKIKQSKEKLVLLPKSSKMYNKMIKSLELPMLLFSGTQDNITTKEDSEKAILNSKNGKVITFEGNHLEGFIKLSGEYFGQKYIEYIGEFIMNTEL